MLWSIKLTDQRIDERKKQMNETQEKKKALFVRIGFSKLDRMIIVKFNCF